MQLPEQKVFSAIWALESQVNNGGFASFLEYEDPALVAFAPEALRIVGAGTCAEIVSRAVALTAVDELDQITDQLDDLDAEFYAYPDDLTDLLYTYVSANPTVFGQMPSVA